MKLKKVKSESVVQQIIDSLTDAIARRDLRPGDKIPKEMELAEQLGVGRNSVREAVKILVYLGVLEIRRAEGTFVCEGFSEEMIDPMVYGLILDKSEDYHDLMEVREMVEVGIMRLAIRHSDEKELSQLWDRLQNLREKAEKGSVDDAFEADNAFHDEITQMCHNPIAMKIDSVARQLTHQMRYESVKGMIESGKTGEFLSAHERLYNIIKDKNEENLNHAVRGTYFVKAGMDNMKLTDVEEKEADEKSGESFVSA
ncbi:MAG: FadR/GntR family transcriptional regulator [Eubacterium sp.]